MIPEPPVTGKSWFKMTPEEQAAMRDYYGNTDFSELMEHGEWVYPDHQSGTIEESIQRGLEQAMRGEVKELDFDIVDDDDELLYPQQLELDLGVIPIPWDENTRYSLIDMRFIYDRELSTPEYNALCDVILDAVDEHFPVEFMSATIRSGNDRELFPEEYDESEESNGTGEEKVQ